MHPDLECLTFHMTEYAEIPYYCNGAVEVGVRSAYPTRSSFSSSKMTWLKQISSRRVSPVAGAFVECHVPPMYASACTDNAWQAAWQLAGRYSKSKRKTKVYLDLDSCPRSHRDGLI